MAWRSCATEVKLAPLSALRARIENQISTWLSQEPAVAPGLVGPQVVEDGVDLLVGVIGDHVVHEGEELGAAPALGVPGLDLAGRDLERGEQVVMPRRLHSCTKPVSARPLGSLR